MPAETMSGTFQRRADGRWVPAIPEPYPLLIRVRCSCGAKFWSREKYRAHYAVVHHGRPADVHP
jgi:hypothetical protein